MTNLKTLRATLSTLAFALVLGAAAAATAAPPAGPASPAPGTIKPDRAPAETAPALSALSDHRLRVRLQERRSHGSELEASVAKDVHNRLHRIAYEKCRQLESSLALEGAILHELKRRETDLRKRIRLSQELENVQRRAESARNMLKVLRVSTKAS